MATMGSAVALAVCLFAVMFYDVHGDVMEECGVQGPLKKLNKVPGKWANLFPSMTFGCDGNMTSIKYYALRKGRFYLGVWEPKGSQYILRNKVLVIAAKAGVRMFKLPAKSQLQVKANQFVGIHYPKKLTKSIISYERSNGKRTKGVNVQLGPVIQKNRKNNKLKKGTRVNKKLSKFQGIAGISVSIAPASTSSSGGSGKTTTEATTEKTTTEATTEKTSTEATTEKTTTEATVTVEATTTTTPQPTSSDGTILPTISVGTENPPPLEEGASKPDPDPSLKYYYIAENGYIYNSDWNGDLLEIASSKTVSDYDRYYGTAMVGKMIANIPNNIFTAMNRHASVGLFNHKEATTDFPEYAHLKDTDDCADSCDGDCAVTCTPSGDKWEDEVGLGGSRATCQDKNFMCWKGDPLEGQVNMLVYYMAVICQRYGVQNAEPKYYQDILDAYENAKDKAIWDVTSHAMSNHVTYFAEATTVFFQANSLALSTGGMNSCGKEEGNYCSTEVEARRYLKKMDPKLYDVLAYVWTENQDDIPSGVLQCSNRDSGLYDIGW